MKLIETKTLLSAAASIEFTSIPQDGTDLLLLISARNSGTSGSGRIEFNTGGTYTRRRLLGLGSTVLSDSPTSVDWQVSVSTDTANTFNNATIYIPNYTSANAKSYSVDSVSENNATAAQHGILAGLWSETSAITTITLYVGTEFVIGSTISLYKITKGSDGIVTTS
jgi:hypothetical protein